MLPFLENVTRGRGIPRERLLEVAEHYLGFGGVSPINAQNRALVAGDRGRLRGPRPGPAGLLGQPQLGALPHRGDGPDRGRRAAAGCSPCSRRRTRRTRAAASTARTSRPPSSRSVSGPRWSTASGTTSTIPGFVEAMVASTLAALDGAARGGPRRRPAGLRDPLGADHHGRGQRPRRPRLHRPAPGRGQAGHRRGRRGDGHRPRARPRLLQPQRAADPAVAGAGRQRPPRGAGRRRRPGRRAGADRLRLRPHGGQVTTSTPRRWRPRGGSGCRSRGPPRWAPTRGSSRRSASWCSSGPPLVRGEEPVRRSLGELGASHDLCPGRLLSQRPRPASGRPCAGRDRGRDRRPARAARAGRGGRPGGRPADRRASGRAGLGVATTKTTRHRHRHRDGPAVPSSCSSTGSRPARPDDGFLGEEGAARAGTSGVTWVVDPIDGTVNYLYEIPAYAVSVAARVGDGRGRRRRRQPGQRRGLDRAARRGRLAGRRRLRLAGRRRWRMALSPPASATTRGAGPGRPSCCGGAAAGARRPPGRGRLAGPLRASRPAGWTATTSRGSSRGTWRPAGWSPSEAGAVVTGLHGRPAGEALVVAARPPLVGALVALLEGLAADADPLA